MNKITLPILFSFFTSLICYSQDMSKLFKSQKFLHHLADFGFKGKVKKVKNETSTYEFNKKGLLTNYAFHNHKFSDGRKNIYTYDKKENLITIIRYQDKSISTIRKFKDDKIISMFFKGEVNQEDTELVFEYDSIGNKIRKTEYNYLKTPVKTTEYKLKYNEKRQVLEISEFETEMKDSIKKIQTVYKFLYNSKGETISEIYYKANSVDETLSIYSRTNYLKDSTGNRLTEYIKYSYKGKIEDITYTYFDDDENIVKVIVSGCLKKIDELILNSYDKIGNKTSYSYQVRKNKDDQSRLRLCDDNKKVQYIKDDKNSDTPGVQIILGNSYNDEMYTYYDNKYEYDYKGNWIKKISYIVEINSSGSQKPVERKVETRKIEYY